jgi:hypothetical protein
MARKYSSIVEAKTLTANVALNDTQITLSNVTGLPSRPYVLVLNPDTASEEVVLVTSDQAGVTSPTLKVQRAIETGASAKTHSIGHVVKHMIVGSDLQLVHDHIDLTTNVHGYTATAAEINILDGATLSTQELNVLDGLTSSTAELNVLDGIPGTLTATELGYVDGVTSSIQTQLNTLTSDVALKAPLNPSTNVQTSTPYTLVLSDASKYIEMNNASANVLTVPLNSSVAFPIGTEITIIQTGAGATTIIPTAGVTVNYYSISGTATRIIKGQWSAATLIKRATDTWVLIGNLT